MLSTVKLQRVAKKALLLVVKNVCDVRHSKWAIVSTSFQRAEKFSDAENLKMVRSRQAAVVVLRFRNVLAVIDSGLFWAIK